MENKNKLLEGGLVFFKLGCFAFGGPAAHIAMMEAEIIAQRKWMTHEHFLDLIGATNLIPGPNSTEMTMHCGHERAGRAGLFVAGIAFIFPAVSRENSKTNYLKRPRELNPRSPSLRRPSSTLTSTTTVPSSQKSSPKPLKRLESKSQPSR